MAILAAMNMMPVTFRKIIKPLPKIRRLQKIRLLPKIRRLQKIRLLPKIRKL